MSVVDRPAVRLSAYRSNLADKALFVWGHTWGYAWAYGAVADRRA